ncbi:MAG: phosphatidate cytidylyltransferase [Chloroflexi bacterium]|nr:phosphatidate cytidylyltransferase [Chloroflexota bacterium]
MLTELNFVWDIAQPLAAIFGAAYVLVPLVELKRHIALKQSVIFQRVQTWTVICAIVLIALALGAPGVAVLFAAIAWQGAREYARVSGLTGAYRTLLLAASPLAVVAAWLFPPALALLPFAFVLVLTVPPLVRQSVTGIAEPISRAAFGFVWIAWPLAHAPLLVEREGGVVWLTVAMLGVSMSDVGAGSVGMLFGHRKLAPVVSPGKTWAGAFGNVLGAALALVVLSPWLPARDPAPLLLLAVAIAAASLWGDLIESLVKRASGVKDAGALLPGFGGILDRIDSLLVALPVVYYATMVM